MENIICPITKNSCSMPLCNSQVCGYQSTVKSSGSVAAPKEEELTAQVELIAWCFYGIGAVGWDMNPHIRWEVAWDKFKETGQLPNSDWKNRRFREVSNCNLLSELASLRQQLKEREELLTEFVQKLTYFKHDTGIVDKSNWIEIKDIIERARKTLNP